MTHRLAMPASSASWAIRAKVGPMLAGAPGQVKSATCSPIFMCSRYAGESTLPSLPQRGGEGPRTGCQMGTSPDIRSVDALGTGRPQAVFHPAIDRPLLAAGCAFSSGDGSPIWLRRDGPVRLAGRAGDGGEGWAVSRDDQVR